MFIGGVDVVDHVLDRSMDDKLISQPWVKLSDEFIDSFQFRNFTDNLSFEGI